MTDSPTILNTHNNRIECATVIPECQESFQEILGVSYIVRCYTCQDGLYLLTNSTRATSPNGKGGNTSPSMSLLYP